MVPSTSSTVDTVPTTVVVKDIKNQYIPYRLKTKFELDTSLRFWGSKEFYNIFNKNYVLKNLIDVKLVVDT